MIVAEILEILNDAEDDGSRLNEIADQFRDGRDVTEVVILLDSSDPELVSIGAWILNELPTALYNSNPFVSRLHKLVGHLDWEVRFEAFAALFPLLDPEEDATQTLLRKLRSDPNEGVRLSAEAAAARWSLT